MKAVIWGISAIFILIVMWTWFAWTWFVVTLPDSTIWEECQDYFGTLLVLNSSHISDSIAYIIFVFFIPMSIISLITSIFLIRRKKAKIWGIAFPVISFGLFILLMISVPSLVIFACKGVSVAITVTFQSFFILVITSFISGIVLVKESK